MTKVQLEELREVIHPAGELESRADAGPAAFTCDRSPCG